MTRSMADQLEGSSSMDYDSVLDPTYITFKFNTADNSCTYSIVPATLEIIEKDIEPKE